MNLININDHSYDLNRLETGQIENFRLFLEYEKRDLFDSLFSDKKIKRGQVFDKIENINRNLSMINSFKSIRRDGGVLCC